MVNVYIACLHIADLLISYFLLDALGYIQDIFCYVPLFKLALPLRWSPMIRILPDGGCPESIVAVPVGSSFFKEDEDNTVYLAVHGKNSRENS